MAELGNHPVSPDFDYSQGIDSSTFGLRLTMPEDGTLTDIYLYMKSGASTTFYAAVFDISATPWVLLTNETAGQSPGSETTGAWLQIPLTSYAVSNGDTIAIMLLADDSSGLVAYGNGGGTTTAGRDDYSNIYGTSPHPSWSGGTPSPGNITGSYTTYLVYTAGGATGNPYYYYAQQ